MTSLWGGVPVIIVIHVILPGSNHCTHFTDKETEAWKGAMT